MESENNKEKNEIRKRVLDVLKRTAPDVFPQNTRETIMTEANIIAGILNEIRKLESLKRWPHDFAYKKGELLRLVGVSKEGKTIRSKELVGLQSSPEGFLTQMEVFLQIKNMPTSANILQTGIEKDGIFPRKDYAEHYNTSRDEIYEHIRQDIHSAKTLDEIRSLLETVNSNYEDDLLSIDLKLSLEKRLKDKIWRNFASQINQQSNMPERLEELREMLRKYYTDKLISIDAKILLEGLIDVHLKIN